MCRRLFVGEKLSVFPIKYPARAAKWQVFKRALDYSYFQIFFFFVSSFVVVVVVVSDDELGFQRDCFVFFRSNRMHDLALSLPSPNFPFLQRALYIIRDCLGTFRSLDGSLIPNGVS